MLADADADAYADCRMCVYEILAKHAYTMYCGLNLHIARHVCLKTKRSEVDVYMYHNQEEAKMKVICDHN